MLDHDVARSDLLTPIRTLYQYGYATSFYTNSGIVIRIFPKTHTSRLFWRSLTSPLDSSWKITRRDILWWLSSSHRIISLCIAKNYYTSTLAAALVVHRSYYLEGNCASFVSQKPLFGWQTETYYKLLTITAHLPSRLRLQSLKTYTKGTIYAGGCTCEQKLCIIWFIKATVLTASIPVNSK